MKYAIICLILLFTNVFSSASEDFFLKEVEEKTSKIYQFNANLKITTNLTSINEKKNISAILHYLKPKLFKIELKDNTMAFNGEYFWNYSHSNNQLLIQNDHKSLLPFEPEDILLNFTNKFEFERIKDTIISKEKCCCYILSNTDILKKQIKSLVLCISRSSKLPVQIDIKLNNGNSSNYNFTFIDLNKNHNMNIFKQTYPNAEIFDMR